MLSSIYSEEFTPLTDTSFTIRLPLSSSSSPSSPSTSVTLLFTLPPSYPAAPPSITVTSECARWVQEMSPALQSRAHEVWAENAGDVCCYQQVEALRELIETENGKRQQEESDRAMAEQTQKAEAEADSQSTRVDNDDWSDEEGEEVEDKADEWQQHKQKQAEAAIPSPLPPSTSPFVTGPSYTDRKSVFIAHLAPLTSPSSLPPLLSYIHTHPRYSRATHNISAYRLSSPSYTESGCDDDGEDRAGGRLLRLLEVTGVVNVVVVVTRFYGGVKLGPERFRIINNVARELLEREGWIEDKKGEGGKGKGGKKTNR